MSCKIFVEELLSASNLVKEGRCLCGKLVGEHNRNQVLVSEMSFKKVLKDISDFGHVLDDLSEKFSKIYSMELVPIESSDISVEQFAHFRFTQFPIRQFIDSQDMSGVRFEQILIELTNDIISLLDGDIILEEVYHIHPRICSLFNKLLNIIRDESKFSDICFETIEVFRDIEYDTFDVNNKNYRGTIDTGLKDNEFNICLLTEVNKNPKIMFSHSELEEQTFNPFIVEGKLTTDCKKGLAQSALQIYSQVQKLERLWGYDNHKKLYGILTNGMEWFIISHRDGDWRHSSVIKTTKWSNTRTLCIDEKGISDLAIALQRVIFHTMSLFRILQHTNLDDRDEEMSSKSLSVSNNNGKKRKEIKSSRGRKAFHESTLTVQNVQALTRKNMPISRRMKLNTFK
mmetsp:Transcript_22350/g.32104  ORF Transcript_22350/g.32104 Transcript_22350/m.32104 type:complete len:400 (+) Transcript_22350:53-1252(+)